MSVQEFFIAAVNKKPLVLSYYKATRCTQGCQNESTLLDYFTYFKT